MTGPSDSALEGLEVSYVLSVNTVDSLRTPSAERSPAVPAGTATWVALERASGPREQEACGAPRWDHGDTLYAFKASKVRRCAHITGVWLALKGRSTEHLP